MPFIYYNNPIKKLRKYHDLDIRDLPETDKLIRQAISNIEDSAQPSFSYPYGKLIWIINGQPQQVNPQNSLTLSCQKQGLNMLEIESWLDFHSENYDGIIHFEVDGSHRINESKIYYRMPNIGIEPGSISILLHYLNKKQK